MFLLIFALLFGAGAIYNVFGTGDMYEAIVGFIITFVLLVTYFIRIVEKKKSQEFVNWVENNEKAIHRGEAAFKGITINANTEIVQFESCMSFLIATFKMPSRYFVRGYHNIKLIGGAYSLVSLLFGWWGIPWGPIYTIQVVSSNSRGGKAFKVGSILTPMDYANGKINYQ